MKSATICLWLLLLPLLLCLVACSESKDPPQSTPAADSRYEELLERHFESQAALPEDQRQLKSHSLIPPATIYD